MKGQCGLGPPQVVSLDFEADALKMYIFGYGGRAGLAFDYLEPQRP